MNNLVKRMLCELGEKKKALQSAERFFNECSQDDIELANLRITVLNEEIRKLYKSIREEVTQNG